MSETPPEITIKPLTADTSAWDQYVQNSPVASLYHVTGWQRVIARAFGHQTPYLAAWQQDRIVGLLPLTFMQSLLFGKFMVSLPFFNYAGIVAETTAIRQALLDEAIRLARAGQAKYIELRHVENFDLGFPVKTSKVLMMLNLPATSEELWNSFKSKLRSQIRRPEKEGLTFKFGQLDVLDHYYELFANKMREHGTPVYAKRFFAEIFREFPETARIALVYKETQPVASGFIIGYKQMLQIPWAASRREFDRVGANMMLYWNILQYACEHGYTQFDFGRSTPDEGTYKFKEQWGAQPVPCYWHYWLASGGQLPELNPHNPKYQMLISVWQRLPLAVTKLIGPAIVKNIP
jgi:serine/alanine adding enzyme